MGASWSQFFPPHPGFTERDLRLEPGRVFIVTGGYAGVGYELCKFLYQAGGKVYIIGRDEAKAEATISKIRSFPRNGTAVGDMQFIYADLSDLTTIKPAAEKFKSAESRLDVLFNNAGISHPPPHIKSPQGYEMQMATNCLGHYLLTQLLLPILTQTAKLGQPGEVRIVWTSSIAVDFDAPTDGVSKSELDTPGSNSQRNYAISKLGNWYLASELSRAVGSEGLLSITQNPGNLQTELTRHLPRIFRYMVAPLLYEARHGAYTNLWAAFSKDLDISDGGIYVVPWGRKHPSPRSDLLAALKSKEEGGNGNAKAFVEWCQKQTERFL